jgi:phosphogluconate dehydratase
MSLNPAVAAVTDRIIGRSKPTRRRYLELMAEQKERGISRPRLSCGNFAHGFAASGEDKEAISHLAGPNIGIVTSYNDMLSAHQPYGRYPEQMKIFAREVGATAQVAGGVPAMCDGVTQGQPGMDLSLFSRDVIAMSTAVALSHGMFDAAALLGICDKIVPGLLIGALRFGHLPMLLVPGGPMPSGLPNKEKQRVRQLYAEGKVGRDELLKAESRSYHSAGTCTFYGTANSNQMMMELMGLHIPNAAFINPGTPLRQALTRAAVHRLANLAKSGERPLAEVVDEKAVVNAAIGLVATGGSTNHFIHLPAIARAAGIIIDWEDFAELSKAVPRVAWRSSLTRSAARACFIRIRGRRARIRWMRGSAIPNSTATSSCGGPPRKAPTLICCVPPLIRSSATAGCGSSRATSGAPSSRRARWTRNAGSSKRRRAASPTRMKCSRHSKRASSIATARSWFASRGRAPTACPSCTS